MIGPARSKIVRSPLGLSKTDLVHWCREGGGDKGRPKSWDKSREEEAHDLCIKCSKLIGIINREKDRICLPGCGWRMADSAVGKKCMEKQTYVSTIYIASRL